MPPVRRLTAILAADVAGYSRLMGADEEGTHERLGGVIQGDSRPREFIPRLVDLFMQGQFPLDRLITRYDLAEMNRADAASGATIKPRCTRMSALDRLGACNLTHQTTKPRPWPESRPPNRQAYDLHR